MEVKPGYKQTEVGVIPEEWELAQIRDVCRLVNGRGFKPFEWRTVGLPIIRIQNLNGSEDFNFYSGQYNPKILVEHGQLLFAWSGSRGTSFGPHVWNGGRALLNYHTWKVVVNETTVTPEFLLYALRQLTSYIEDRAHGASALVHTQKWEMEKFPITFPASLPEQRAIATALSDVDGLLGGLDRLIAKKRDLKQAAMQQLLTGQTRLPGFHGEWEVKTLRECARFCSGTYLAQDAYRDGPFEVQGAGSQMGKHIATNFPEPVSVIGRVGTVGRPRFMPFGCWVNNNAAAIVALPGKATPSFVHFLLMTMDWRKATSVTAQPFLVIESLMKMEFQLPPLPEQTAIAEVLTDMDAELAALEQRREKTRALKQAMMQELLTGKTRLISPQKSAA